MEGNGRGELVVHNTCHRLPQELDADNAEEVNEALGNESGSLPYALFREMLPP